jgi:hypothetical protein
MKAWKACLRASKASQVHIITPRMQNDGLRHIFRHDETIEMFVVQYAFK